MNGRPRTALVTGAAGFIGYHVALRLLGDGWRVAGLDNLSAYYDPGLKRARLDGLLPHDHFSFLRLDVADPATRDVVADLRPDVVVHLAAQAGVRHSVDHPDEYVQSNLVGFFQVLEACRRTGVSHLVYASSSSVYGGNTAVPFRETDPVDHPLSLYAATKKADELMAHAYSHLYGIPATGLRFFTVYGPFGRPDMAYYSFADSYFRGEPITVFSDDGQDLSRDFTYVDDIVEGVARVIASPPAGPGSHWVLNIGRGAPVGLTAFIDALEGALGTALGRAVSFRRTPAPMAPGDVRATWASTDALRAAVGYAPTTTITDGLQQFANWYVTYHGKG